MSEFKHLFTPIQIGSVTVRNRIGVPPHGTGRLTKAPERWIQYFVERAKGGAGWITTGDMGPLDPGGVSYPSTGGVSGIWGMAWLTPEWVPHLKRTAEMVHEYGAKIIGQVGHPGRAATSLVVRTLQAPSPIPDTNYRETPHELEVEEIKVLLEAIADSYALFQEAGYDGGELHGAHGYLIMQFLSPFSNKRTDDYGGSLENRMRFINELTDLIRQKCGRDFVLGTRLSGDELTPGGLTLADMQEVCKALEDRGQLDYFSICAGNYWRTNASIWLGPDMNWPLGMLVPIASGIRSVLKKTPVFTVNRINDPVQAEKILADGHADLILMARALLCDPEWPTKAREGRVEDIRKCMACTQGCVGRRYAGEEARCVQNPAAGEELDWGIGTLQRAQTSKKVVVVGGGPAGMKAAEIATERGHDVTIIEKNEELGGQVNILVKDPKREEFGELTRYLKHRVKQLGIKVKLGTEATPDMVLAENPDAVVVATGVEPKKPPIPGIDQPNVFSTWEVLQGKATVGNKVVVLGLENNHWEFNSMGELLAAQGKQVEMVTGNLFNGVDLPVFSIGTLNDRLANAGVVLHTLTVCKEISGSTVTVMNAFSLKERKIENVDTVVYVPLKAAATGMYRALKGKVKELYAIGDCYSPRKVDSAILEGEITGRKL